LHERRCFRPPDPPLLPGGDLRDVWFFAAVATLPLTAPSCANRLDPERPEKRLWISATAVVLPIGDTTRLGATVEIGRQIHQTPEVRASWPRDLRLTWFSSAPAVVRVDSTGLLKAESVGRAEVWLEVDALRDSATVIVVSNNWQPSGRFASVATGGDHTCASSVDREVYCWGSSWFGQLGLGSERRFTAALSPVRVALNEPVVAIDASGRHSCALAASGGIYCWGENRWGQLGNASRTSSALPVIVRASETFVSVSVGPDDSCALNEGGFAYCWGRSTNTTTPRRVDARTFLAMSVGGFHACALDADRAAYCWGSNRYGQLGTGTTLDADEPVAVRGAHRFRRVSAGVDHTCGIREDGVALCWGNGWAGRLGTGGGTTSVPTPVAAELVFEEISAGLEHTCALTASGQAFCWGSSVYGQSGTRLTAEPGLTLSELFVGVPTAVASELRFTSISASEAQHTCALTAEGASYCWGANTTGELGYGKQQFHPETQQNKRSLPVRVAGPW
jgi:alpha-tubulin suppressor-like RCC1 family protein